MFEISQNKISLGKEDIYAFAAELHYFRLEKRYWSICFERLKRAGIRLISTPVPWNLHQDKSRNIDFLGYDDARKDLTVFLELARELGFKVILRPGPYIGADWPNGGAPEFVTSDLRSLARDHNGDEIPLAGAPGIKRAGYLASYMSPAFQNSLKHYFKAFVDATRNYIHPRGPVVIVEIDDSPSFGGLTDPAASDYNADMLAREFNPFMMSRYEDIKALNSAYRTKFKDYDEIEPLREFEHADQKSLPRMLDWFRFKEHLVQRYFDSLSSIYESYTVQPLYSRSKFFTQKGLVPFYDVGASDEQNLSGCEISYQDSYSEVIRRGRYLRGETSLPWSSAYPFGRAAEDPKLGESLQPITDGERRFMLASALGSGFKGIDMKMFADHSHWYGAPLKSDGSVTPGYEFVKRIVESAERMGLDELAPDSRVAVVGNRLYQWFSQLPNPKDFEYIQRLVNDSFPGICRDLSRLKIDYDVRESGSIEKLTNYRLVIIPSAEFMPESEQQAIIDLYKAGVSVAVIGVLPKLDENMSSCPLLANFLKTKSTLLNSIDTITTKTKTKTIEFPAHVFSTLKSSDARAKKIAHAGKSLVGVAANKQSAALNFFGFDISSGFDHHKLTFLESFLADEEINSAVYCSDPMIDVTVHSSAKKVVIFLTAPPAGELGDRVETQDKEFFMRVDLKKIGYKTPSIKMVDLFEPEETPPLKLTSAALATGLHLRLSYPDGKVFFIEKR
jgi:beta-galactosidase